MKYHVGSAKGVVLLALTLLLVLLTTAALAATGTVHVDSLVLRKSPSTESAALQTLDRGDRLDILEADGSWYKVRYGKYTGYVYAKYVKTSGTIPSSSNASDKVEIKAEALKSSVTLRPGTTSGQVMTLQQKLKALGYYSGSVNGTYNSATKSAVKAFQKKHGLEQDGVAGPKTLRVLLDASAAKTETLRQGDTGSEVKSVQRKLQELNYYSGSIDGIYGEGTAAAVRAFQKKKGLTQDGVAGPATLKALENASEDDAASPRTESLVWFKGGDDVIPRGAVFTIKDVKTGKTFRAKRWAGSNHADTEPLTREDARIMKEIYGGSWSWTRRPILVSYDGHVYAASMNGYPHGTTTIINGFDGHFCIHFTGSKTHGTDKVDSDHQDAVRRALEAEW